MTTREQIPEIITFAVADRTTKNMVLHLNELSDADAGEMLQRTGLDVKGYIHTLDKSGINHTLKNHGAPKQEALRGLVAIEKEDLLIIPLIIIPANIIGRQTDRQGKDCILYEAVVFEDIFYYVEEIRTGRKQLNIKTMYKRKLASKRLTSFRFW